MNKQKIVPIIVIIISIIGYCYMVTLRFSPKAAIQGWPVKDKGITILEKHDLDSNNTLVAFKDNKDNSYGVAHLKSLNGFLYRSKFVGRGEKNDTEKPTLNVCILSGYRFINYIIVNNEKAKYVAMGSEYKMYSELLSKKDITLEEVRDKDEFYEVKEIRDDNTVCFWGMLTDEEYVKKGRILLFNEKGTLIYSKWLF
ncbi:hypothetical protein [Oceanirhabdus sp. W0125-5]|uniref:hypothetical protein n=1 Tax=Oceanirhabdus sp. W0125-5 TaxID=2999116 RepID=UPI0022F30A44|nr:hypothetical protein [Oceanirhabdus sp. W0125-5]WBW96322.1 hypothetical protein OW730_21900 [Oceanirhabdus sp. W0125-5]